MNDASQSHIVKQLNKDSTTFPSPADWEQEL